jgi:NAD(P)-dependent dehydrogenase (short-subunit alcohol dehydrogenase family)
MTRRLEGKVAAITGAASGIGEATARRFIEEGARVVIGDIQQEAGQALADELGDAATFYTCDVTSEDDIAGLIDHAVDTFGWLDIMMNNAGIVGARGPIAQTDMQHYDATMAVLLRGTFMGMKHAARVMQPRQTGSIISLASTAGVQGGLGPHVYATAKHAVVGLTKNVAAELCRSGIRVNCIAPGSTATPMVAKAHLDDHTAVGDVVGRLTEISPIKGRPALAIDVANVALFLASDEAGNVNGHCLAVDGGLTTGSSTNDPPYSTPQPFMREAGRSDLPSSQQD